MNASEVLKDALHHGHCLEVWAVLNATLNSLIHRGCGS